MSLISRMKYGTKGQTKLTGEDEGGVPPITVEFNINTAPAKNEEEVESEQKIEEVAKELETQEEETELSDVITGEAESLRFDLLEMRRNPRTVNKHVAHQVRQRVMFLERLSKGAVTRTPVIMPTAESGLWDNAAAVPGNLHFAYEFVGDMIKQGWDWLIKLIREWQEKIATIWNEYVGAAARTLRSAKALQQRVANSAGKYSGKPNDGNTIDDSSLAKKLNVGLAKLAYSDFLSASEKYGTITETMKDAYLAAMGDSNFEEACKFLAAEETYKADAQTETNKVKGMADAYAAFNMWTNAMATALGTAEVVPTKETTSDELKKLGYKDTDIGNYIYYIGVKHVLPGNKTFVKKVKAETNNGTKTEKYTKNDTEVKKGADHVDAEELGDALEAITIRCSDYIVNSDYSEKISSEVPVLTGGQMEEILRVVVKVCEGLVQFANTVDKGKNKRRKLNDAIKKASDRSAHAEKDEAKTLNRARKLGTIMAQQIDNPANEFQVAMNKGASAMCDWVRKSMGKYD